MNSNLVTKSKWLFFLFILFICLHFNLLNCSEIETSSQDSEISAEQSGYNDELYSRPDGASSLKFKKSFFDAFKKEVTIDKYITKEGKKVKVKLIRRSRPIFGWLSRWYRKKKAKSAAKKKARKERKSKSTEKRKGLLSRFKKKKSEKHKTEDKSSIESESREVSDEVEPTGIFEDDAIVSDAEGQQSSSSIKMSGLESSGDQSSLPNTSDYRTSMSGDFSKSDES
ncbi:hypothetical protein FG379_001752 [Cryptosporidium bovis]|uniref:uncharacterized protein n=1 Tax=Cryptosporidium bovis TaxID=310047 RepID=UPI00351A1666|nr:hypothetical protein FG379_001752 [Cryptosporidium bovis]